MKNFILFYIRKRRPVVVIAWSSSRCTGNTIFDAEEKKHCHKNKDKR